MIRTLCLLYMVTLWPSWALAQIDDFQSRYGIDRESADLTAIRTDPEIDAILEKAERFKEDNNFRVATQLLQACLERSGDALYSEDNQTYFSLVRQVEQRLSQLPPEGLEAYRLIADAEAKALIASSQQGDKVAALNEVVRKYFISSVGDEAAFRLGSLYLEQYDFVGAQRMFEKTLRHPDPSVSAAETHVKMAVCDLFLGEVESAQQNIDRAVAIEPRLRSAKLVQEKITTRLDGDREFAGHRSTATPGITMPLGAAIRYNVSLPVDDRMHNRELVAAFQYYYEPKTKYLRAVDTRGIVLAGQSANGNSVDRTRNGIESRLISQWLKNRWRPAGMLLFDSGQVIFETAQDLVALNTSALPISMTNDVSEKLPEQLLRWRSVWPNRFRIDPATEIRQTIERQFGGRRRGLRNNKPEDDKPNGDPASLAEVQLFGDQISSQMSIHNGILYSLEGDADDGFRSRRVPVRRTTNWGQGYTRSRIDRLVAYDLERNGVVLWQLPVQFPVPSDQRQPVKEEAGFDELESDFLTSGGLMGAPVGFGNSVLAAVNHTGAIWVYAFDPSNQGKTIWKSFLCDEPPTGAQPWSPINISVDGSDVFVSCGLGILFVLDASSGQVRLARRYQRGGAEDSFFRDNGWGGLYKKVFNQGWSSDTIIPYRRQLICLCSDAKQIESIDRQTGELLWAMSFEPISCRLDYVLGVRDGVLYLGGTDTIAAIDLDRGRLLWGGDLIFGKDSSFGKGMLTDSGIYMPVGRQIFRYALAPVQRETMVSPIDQMQVDLGGVPVGNLFSDGDRFWVHGGNRIYALEVKPR